MIILIIKTRVETLSELKINNLHVPAWAPRFGAMEGGANCLIVRGNRRRGNPCMGAEARSNRRRGSRNSPDMFVCLICSSSCC